MNRVLLYLNNLHACDHSRHLRWLDRMKQAVEQLETAANLDEGFEFFVPNLSSLIEGDKERNVRICFWRDSKYLDDIENLPSITAEVIREYADQLLAAASRIDASGHRLEAVLLSEVSDIRNRFLTARKTKQDRETVHKLHSDTLVAIEKLPVHESGLLFPWPFKRRQIFREFGKLLDKADLPGGRRNKFHKLRRTSATHLAAVAGMEAAEEHLDHKTHGLARSTYVDPRFMPTVKAADVLPRP